MCSVAGLRLSLLLLVLAPVSATAAVFTAGPTGTHTTAQGAINAALANAGDDEVRIQTGTWLERLTLINNTAQRVDISGGWNAAFDAQTADPALTVIDAELLGRTFHVEVNDGVVTLRNVSLTRGRTTFNGGNVYLVTRGDGVFELSDCDIGQGEAQNSNNIGFGAGFNGQAFNTSHMEIQRCRIHDNLVNAPGSAGYGAGLYAATLQTATLLLSEIEVVNNRMIASVAVAAGMYLDAWMESDVEVRDGVFADNTMEADALGPNGPSGVGILMELGLGTAKLEFRRNQVLRNTITVGAQSQQFSANTKLSTQLIVADSLIADSPGDAGLQTQRSDAAQVQLVNLTLAGNAGPDLNTVGGATVTNTLADTVGANIGDATVVKSRFGPGQFYVNRAAGDYRLQLTSPDIGAGTLTPVGGLGPLDLDGNPRVRGYGVDLGAYEADDPSIFADSFEAL